METPLPSWPCPDRLYRFKIDLIVWKPISEDVSIPLIAEFKIDLIVWKLACDIIVADTSNLFKIDLIVWKLHSIKKLTIQ